MIGSMKILVSGLLSVFIVMASAFELPASSASGPVRSEKRKSVSLQGKSAEKISGIKGTVLSEPDGSPLEFVTVALVDTAGTVMAGAVTDSAGLFSLKLAGAVLEEAPDRLVFSLVGYKEVTMQLSDAASGNAEMATGGVLSVSPVYMDEDTQMLEGARVAGKRPLIEHQFDRLVLNVSELAVAQTGDALDVLKSSPGVTVDKDGNVKLNGSTVSVWIDGRPSNMSGADLEAYLKGSAGTSIEKVELISNPSAKYDAEGSGGIINIKTRRAFMKGFSGTLGARSGIRYAPGSVFSGNVSANVMYRTDKTNTYLQYTPSWNGFAVSLEEMKLYGADNSRKQESVSEMKNMWRSHLIRLGNDWNVSDKDIVGVIFRTTVSPGQREFYTAPNIIRDYTGAGTPMERLYTEMEGSSYSEENGESYSVNLNYTRTFDQSVSQELTLNADWYRTSDRSEHSLRNLYSFISPEALADGVGDNGFDDSTYRILDLYSLKADFSQSFWKQTGRVEAGLKAAYSSTRNRYGKYDYDFVMQAQGPQTERNDFTYDEQVYAGYFNVAKKFSDKWNAQAGVRGEYTVQEGDWLMTSDESRKSFKDYFDVFPNAFLNYMHSKDLILTASYSYRISRPKYWQLNPFRSYASTTSYTQGNIELEPSYSHNVSLTSVLFGRLSLTGGYSRTANFSDIQTPYLDENGMMGLIYSNAGDQQVAFATASLSELPLFKWWNLTVNASYYYTDFNAYKSEATEAFGGTFSNERHSFSMYASTTFFLPRDFKLGIDGWLSTPQSAGYFTVNAIGMLNFSITKTFWDGKGTLSLYVNDILDTCDSDLSIMNGGVKTYMINQSQSNGSVTLGFNWRFGNGGQQKRRNVGSLDEESRL